MIVLPRESVPREQLTSIFITHFSIAHTVHVIKQHTYMYVHVHVIIIFPQSEAAVSHFFQIARTVHGDNLRAASTREYCHDRPKMVIG